MNSDHYQQFLKYVRDVSLAQSIEAVLDWDQETYMPPRAAPTRAAQAAWIAGVAHERFTSDAFGKLLQQAERGVHGDADAQVNLREVRRLFDRAVRLPTTLVQEIASCTALAKEAWGAARSQARFALFAPHLERMLDLKRQVAEKYGWNTEPYDALLDEYEPGAKAHEIQQVFDALKPELVRLVRAIAGAPRRPDTTILSRCFPVEGQAAFSRMVAEAMGFDFEAGRIDRSKHPFCTSFSPLDVRLTTRYREDYVPMSLFGTMHEAGHGLYEQGLPAEHAGTPLARAVSLGIHESQSRLWENMIGRGRPFWEHYYPALQREFAALSDVALDDWLFAINTVKPSFIRVEADEVTYGLHIMLRFDLERRLVAGTLAVKDVPAAWNDGMKALLGITPASDAEGCLQDIHWSSGLVGYFPTYQLGNLYAAQFMAAAEQAMPRLHDDVRAGRLRPLREWLLANIHQHGQRYRAHELVQRIAGGPLAPGPYLRYLQNKFAPLYGL